MARCDFPTVYAIIKKHCIDCSATKQANLVPGMFFTFDDNSPTTFKAPQINRWITGKEPIVREVAGFYAHPSSREYLRIDLEDVLDYIIDEGLFYEELYDLILNDISVSDLKRNEILEKYSGDKLDFFADVVFLSISRKPENMLAPKFPSALVEERIIDGDVPKSCKFFCGRDKELEELHSLLYEHSKIFVTGIAGIGKSEFVKAYAKQYKSEYTNILYYQYNGSLQHLISDIEFTDDLPNENETDKFKKHNRFLRALKEDSLIIIDNFNTTANKEQQLDVLLKYKCRFIFTTRSRFDCGYTFELKEIESIDTLVDLFGKFYTETESCRDTVVDIIETVYHHTFIVELAARHLQKGLIEPDELLEKLKESSVDPRTTDKISISKDGLNPKETYYVHLQKLFSLSSLKGQTPMIMRCMVFVPQEGIIAKTLAKWCALSDMNEINDLVELGYISEDDTGAIMLLPVIKDIVIADLKPTYTSCTVFLASLHNICRLHGAEIPFSKMLFSTIENVIKYISIDDMPAHLLFIEDAFDYMEKYRYESEMKLMIAELEKHKKYFSDKDTALLFDFKAAVEAVNKEYKAALEYSKKAVECLAPDSELLLSANLNMNLGYYYHLLGELDSAKKHMETGMKLYAELNQLNHDFVIMTHNYANLLSDCGEHIKAVRALKKCAETVKEDSTDMCVDYADLCFSIGIIYLKINDEASSLSALEKAFRIYRELLSEAALKEKIGEAVGFFKSCGISNVPDFLLLTER